MSVTFRSLFQRRSAVAVPTSPGHGWHQALTAVERIHWDRSVVLSVARSIDPDDQRVMHWFVSEPIAEFGGKTAKQIIGEGATASLLDMLVAIRSGQRDN